MSGEVKPLYNGPQTVELRISLELRLPGRLDPFFIDGMSLLVDRYMYEVMKEDGALDDWLKSQAVQKILEGSKMHTAPLLRGW